MIPSGGSMSSLWIFLAATLVVPYSCYPIHPIPGYIKPKDYDLHILMDDSGYFVGEVQIKFETGSGTPSKVNSLVLNGENLLFTGACLNDSKGKEEFPTITTDKTLRTVHLELNAPLEKSLVYSLTISFSGNASKDGRGLHSLNNLKGFYMTNLWPIYSRRLFPCFDSPEKKAVFKLTLDTNNTYAVSNMPLLRKEKTMNGFRHIFKETPEIPVHSLFFLTGPTEFTPWSNFYWGNVSLNLYPNFPKILFFNSIFQVANSSLFQNLWKKSSLGKLNVLVVPDLVEPFYSGFGVLVLRDELVKFDIYDTTTQIKLEAAYKILEGFLHVFYGSVVSPSHWEKNWLTSSIAHYLKFRAFNTDEMWSDLDEFKLLDVHFKTLSTSWQPSSDPVQPTTPFKDTNELETFIKGSSQIKGASVLFMLETLIAGDKLEMILFEFLDKNKYKDYVDENTLFVELSMVIKNVPVKMNDFLSTWLTQRRLPLVELSMLNEVVTLTESVYSNEDKEENATGLWAMPVTYTTRSNTTDLAPIWFLDGTTTIKLNVSENDWVVVAVDGKVPLVSMYDDRYWYFNGEALQQNMKSFSPSTRAKLVGDAFRMAKDGRTSYLLVLNLLRYLDNERALAPWLKAIEGFKEMYSWIFYTSSNSTFNLKADFQTYVINRMSAVYHTLGFESNNIDHKADILRKEIIGAMCYFGYKHCRSEAMKLYLQAKDKKYIPSNDIRTNLVCAGMRTVQKEEEWMQMYGELMNRTLTDPILDLYLDVLACPTGENSKSIRKYLNMIFLENGEIPVSKISVAYRAIYSKAEHINQALYFLLDRSVKITKISPYKLAELLNDVTEYISTTYHDKLLKTFLESHKSAPKPIVDAVKLGRDKFQNKQSFIMKNANDIHAGLDTLPTLPPPATPSNPPTKPPTTSPPTTRPPTTGPPTTVPPTTEPPTIRTTSTLIPVPTTPAPESAGLSVGSISLITIGVLLAAAVIGLIFYYSCRRGGCCA